LHCDGVAAQTETDFADDLKRITVPLLVMHSEDDQLVPNASHGHGTLKAYKDFPHGMPATHADITNADLPAFIKA
jgi:non-heme chloroperoxidase